MEKRDQTLVQKGHTMIKKWYRYKFPKKEEVI